MKNARWIIAVLATGLIAGCGTSGSKSAKAQNASHAEGAIANQKSTPELEIVVTAAGVIKVEGELVTLEQLSTRLDQVKAANGQVWFYRDPQGEPHPNAQRVIQLIIDHSLPVMLSTKPDFSTYVDDSRQERRR